MADIARIEERLDRVAAGNTAVSDSLGGIAFQNMTEVMEFAKLMSLSGNAVPKHLQGNPGMCLAVCVQAMEWRFSPFAVANKSYEVQSRLSFESQLVHAVIEQRAPIVGRLRFAFEGEGEERICIVTAKLRETGETLEYRSPPFNKITPKNSPLWKTKPDLQLYYNTSRDFCRAYFPDVLLGVYAAEELRDHHGPDNARDVNERPSVGQRLKAKGARGFSQSHVERESRGGVVDESSTTKGDAGHSELPHDATLHERTEPLKASATDAQGRPDRTETVDGAQPGGGHEVGASASEPVRTSDAPNSLSPEQAAPHPNAQADTPAVEDSPLPETAGNNSESSATSPSDDEAQAGGSSGAGLPSTLPVGWHIAYSGALRRAQKKESLPKYAAEFWKAYGGWDAIKVTDARETAVAIYDAFNVNFGNKAAVDEALRELI